MARTIVKKTNSIPFNIPFAAVAGLIAILVVGLLFFEKSASWKVKIGTGIFVWTFVTFFVYAVVTGYV